MNQTLATKYRPTSFKDMVGQKINALVLSKMIQAGDIPAGLLFTGVRGSGKTTAARILANKADAGEPIEVDAAAHGSVQDVREMIDTLRFSSGGTRRIIIYDEAHSMSKEAFNALLKTLEEPPAGVTFILVSTEPEKIPGTVKSRMMQFTFNKISVADITQRLAQIVESENATVSPELLTFIAERADGAMRDGIMLLDQCIRAGISTKTEFLELAGEADLAPQLVKSLLTGDHATIFSVADDLSQRIPDPSKLAAALVGVLKDILILHAGGKLSLSTEALAIRAELARHIENERILAALKIIWDLRTKARQAGDPRSNLDLALVLLSEIFTRGKTPLRNKVADTPKPAPESRRLTLDEL